MRKLGATIVRETLPNTARPTPEPLRRIASVVRYGIGETIYFEEQRVDHWYRMVSGAARECALTPGGRRQIVGFLLPGDVFGFSCRGARTLAGEIIAEATLLECFPRRQAEDLAESDPSVARSVREMAFDAIDRMQARMLLLGCSSALEKVSAFLLEMASRSASAPGQHISLPMSRYDIADYLGLAVETVSRTVTALRQQGTIALDGTRRVKVLDPELLAHLGRASSPLMHAHGHSSQCQIRGGAGVHRPS